MNCLNCGEILKGRRDKKYCDQHCKSAYQYAAQKGQQSPFFVKVAKQLRVNRTILKKYNVAGKAIVRHEVLIKEGFNPSFFTHYWRSLEGNVYLFIYEYGFMKTVEHNRTKYVLIQWQEYMNKSV